MAPQAGEMDLSTLLSTMSPDLHAEIYVFLTTQEPLETIVSKLKPKMIFQEAEGTTVIATQDLAAANGFEYTFACQMITLNIHSNLEAVGFMAAISAKLTENGLSSNVVSGYFHDHLFIPVEKAELAMDVLRSLSNSSK